ATQQWNSFALTVGKCTSSGTSIGNALEHFIALTVAKYSSRGIFITGSRNDLEHFIPNNPPLNLMLHLPVSPASAVPVPINSAGTPLSTTIDQDAPSQVIHRHLWHYNLYLYIKALQLNLL
nr:hypothetical protein [Tanacetum cinerariifolium]